MRTLKKIKQILVWTGWNSVHVPKEKEKKALLILKNSNKSSLAHQAAGASSQSGWERTSKQKDNFSVLILKNITKSSLVHQAAGASSQSGWEPNKQTKPNKFSY